VDGLWATKSEGVRLIVRQLVSEISKFQPMCDPDLPILQTDAIPRFVLKCISLFLSLWSVSRGRSRIHEYTPCRSIHSAPSCRRQAKVERAQIILNRSQPGLPRSSSSSSPVFGRTPNAGPKSSGVVLTDVGTAQMTSAVGG